MNVLISEINLLEALDFAAKRHRFQRRKDQHATPYINHPIQVAKVLASAGESDVTLLMAAVLHDTIEDTNTGYDELKEKFGHEVADIVLELTDDKRLSKEERKARQVQHASTRSVKARMVKLADKICNVSDILHHPPHDWSEERKVSYFEWALEVVNMLRGTQPVLEKEFDELYLQAKERFRNHQFAG
jgi:guanosine-3',5'-bis(diphosphate) 3'-pyrophosphohydrolase